MIAACDSCRHHCCRFPHKEGFTFVGLGDARRIRRKTGKPFSFFLDYSPLPARVIEELRHDDPSMEGGMRCRQLDRGRILRLKTKKDGDCIFLTRGRCEIYDVRPRLCRIYPYWGVRLLDGRMKILSHDDVTVCSLYSTAPNKEEILSLFASIENEDRYYRRNIRGFLRNNSLLPDKGPVTG